MNRRREGLRIRLDPNNVQAGFLAGCGGAARVAYNFAVEQLVQTQRKFDAARAAGLVKEQLPRPLTAIDIQQRWHAVKAERYPWWESYPSKLYLFAFRNAIRAHRAWMKGTAGFPNFKARGYTTAFTVCETVDLRPGRLLLPKLGEVRIAAADDRQAALRRLVRRGRARVTSVTVSRDSCGTWWASLAVERTISWEPEQGDRSKQRLVVGVDVGVKTLAVAATSDGALVLETPPLVPLRRSQRRLLAAQRSVSRKDRSHANKTGSARIGKSPSKRREKARKALAAAHRRNANRRSGHLHQLTRTLADLGASVVIEDLNVKGMTAKGGARKKGLNRKIAEAGFGELRRQLAYKLGEGRLVIADRFYPSSKTCSTCGKPNTELTLADRSWTCANCGTTHDRDTNAATNLAAWGETRPGRNQAGDPDRTGPVSRGIPVRPQRGTPRRTGNRPTPERPASPADTAGTRPHPARGVSDLDSPGQGPVATTRINAKRH